MLRTLSLILAFMFGIAPCPAQEFSYRVKHRHVLKDCSGILFINSGGISFEATDLKDSRKWSFAEIRTLEVKSPARISVVTYEDQKRWIGKDKIFEFELMRKQATPDLSALLLAHVKRPMKLALIPDFAEKPQFEIQVKHLHLISGTMGVLRIYADKVVYATAAEGDSRIWRIQDIEHFSQPDRFRFQIVSYIPQAGGPNESYNFQLLEDLPEGFYNFLWVLLHPSSYYPGVQ